MRQNNISFQYSYDGTHAAKAAMTQLENKNVCQNQSLGTRLSSLGLNSYMKNTDNTSQTLMKASD